MIFKFPSIQTGDEGQTKNKNLTMILAWVWFQWVASPPPCFFIHTDVNRFEPWGWRLGWFPLPVADVKAGVVPYGTSRVTSQLTHNRSRWPRSHSLPIHCLVYSWTVYQCSFQEPCCQQEVWKCTTSTIVAFMSYVISSVGWATCQDWQSWSLYPLP